LSPFLEVFAAIFGGICTQKSLAFAMRHEKRDIHVQELQLSTGNKTPR
jgi:hypothetical protein